MSFKSLVLSVFLVFFISACGTDNSETIYNTTNTTTDTTVDDVNTTDNTIDVNGTVTVAFTDGAAKTLTLNSEVKTIEVLVFGPNNAPYTGGNIVIAYPDKVRTGTDIGTFSAISLPVENGKATFTYIGPKDLQALVDAGDTGTVFGFYHDSDEATVKNLTFTYEPEANQVILETYTLGSSLLDDQDVTIGLQSSKQVSFYVQDEAGQNLDSADVTSIDVEVLNTPLVDIENTAGDVGDTLTFSGKNDVSLNIKTNTISGLVPIKVTANFVDANEKNATLEKTFNIVVLSGPPTSISISYASTGWDEENAMFQEHYSVKATDKYSNKVNTNPAISVGAIVGYARDATNGERIFYRPNTVAVPSATTATINPSNNVFRAANVDFSDVDELNEVLVTFGMDYDYDASGKWDFTRVGTAGADELVLVDNFDGNITRTNLGFAVGNNIRDYQCEAGAEAVANLRVSDGSNKLDAFGRAQLTLDYDYYLTGKDIVVWVNMVGSTAQTATEGKFGEAREFTLRGRGFEQRIVTVPRDVNNVTYRIWTRLADAPEWYRNANIGYDVQVSDNLTINAVSDSNGNIDDCSQSNGVVYVDVTVTENKGETGSIEIINITVADEFEN